mmetsp:Transcript_9935/g.30141  ORF Transcript_9935/g.30141 Transcript_9935/m.30141 type:complete len:131 (-) Transcript_9935:646-1038(-)
MTHLLPSFLFDDVFSSTTTFFERPIPRRRQKDRLFATHLPADSDVAFQPVFRIVPSIADPLPRNDDDAAHDLFLLRLRAATHHTMNELRDHHSPLSFLFLTSNNFASLLLPLLLHVFVVSTTRVVVPSAH